MNRASCITSEAAANVLECHGEERKISESTSGPSVPDRDENEMAPGDQTWLLIRK
jgi:hypothetical protein